MNPFRPPHRAQPAKPAPAKRVRAEVDLVPAGGSGVTGRIYLEQVKNSPGSDLWGGGRGEYPNQFFKF
jgi:hypothetical protein